MTLVYVGLLGLGFTLLLSGVYNVPYITTVQSILSGTALPSSSSSSSNKSVTTPNPLLPPGFPTNPFTPILKA